MGLFDKTKTTKCPNGTKVTVFKDPNDAFRMTFKDWDASFNAGVNAAGEIGANADAHVAVDTKLLLARLDDVNTSMQMRFNAIYIRFWTDPCKMGGWWTQRLDEAIEDENRLRAAMLTIGNLRSSGTMTGDFVDVINKVINDLLLGQRPRGPVAPIGQVSGILDSWEKPPL